MNFAIPFFKAFQYLQDENLQLNINYKPKIKELLDFVEIYGTHRINLIFQDFKTLQTDIEIILALKEKYPDSKLVVAAPPMVTLYQINLLKNNQISFYFNKTVTNIDEFNNFLNLGVCDIEIGGWLGFFLENLSKKARKNGISLRVRPDICHIGSVQSFKRFFIRPDDIDIYAKYVDTFEFAHPQDNINTIYEIYAKNKKWYGKLKEIIIGYEGEQDSRFILPTFAEIRMNCKKRCAYDIDHTCNICGRMVEFGQSLASQNIIITKENEDGQANINKLRSFKRNEERVSQETDEKGRKAAH